MYRVATGQRLFSLALALSFTSVCWGQSEVKKSTGAPTTIYNGSSIDDVNLSSGNLQITIPLVHLPGRGLDTDIVLVYNSKIWKTDIYIDPAFGETDTHLIDYDTNQSPAYGWSLGWPRMGRFSFASQAWQDLSPTYSVWVEYKTWIANDGTRIRMVNDNGLQWSPPGGIVTGYWSIDGTYARSTGPSGIIFKDGVTTGPPQGTDNFYYLKDTNGNSVNCNNTLTICTDTVGRTFNFTPNSITYKDSSGGPQAVTFTFENRTLYFPYATTAPSWSSGSYPTQVLKKVTLANGLTYQFEYALNSDGTTSTGEISKIILPTGGYIRYDYGWTVGGKFGEDRALVGRFVSEDGTPSSEKAWTYSYTVASNGCFYYPGVATTVTDPVGNVTVYSTPAETTKNIEYKNPAGVVVQKQVQTIAFDNSTYNDPFTYGLSCATESNPRITSTTTILSDTNQQSKTDSIYGSYGNVLEKKEYDWGVGSPGGLLRRTTFSYLHDAYPTYATTGVHIVNRVSTTTIYTGTGTQVAQTTNEYDNYTEGLALSGAVQHDANYGTSYTSRGNVTAINRWRNTDGALLTTRNQYDDTGNILKTTDPLLRSTTFSYAGSWGNASCAPLGGNAAAYVTTMTDALSHISRKTYNSCTGTVASATDVNGQPTTFAYDLMHRPTQKNLPDGGQTTICYSEILGSSCYSASLPLKNVTTTKIDSTKNLQTTTVYDGLGRVKQSQLTSDPDCPSGDKTDTTYDALGRVYTISNPYCIAGESTSGLTTYAYDALGRTTQVKHPDNTTVLTTYTGRAIQVQDEGNGNGTQRITRISQIDGLGRLASVCEVTSATLIGSGGTPVACGQDIAATGFLTSYQYDALDNLTSVSMNGLNPRTFAYDSLSRLTSATNPETGQICYGTVSAGVCQANGYDANGNLVTKTDARSIITTFSYDALNRLTGKTYSDGTPAATFNYDQSSALGVILANTIGRKSSQSTVGPNATGSVFSYDTTGRISNNSQCTPQNCGTGVFAFQYPQYDFVGDLISATNAAGVTFSYAYNTVARLTGITTNFIDGSHPGTLLSNAHYSPFGALTSATLGNSVTESWSYNNRLWQQSRTATFGATTPYSFNIATFAPNGDILAANDGANGNWVYKYDDFNRLTCSNLASNGTCATPTSGTPTYTYDYDRFGNRWHQNGSQSSQLGFDANNRMTGVTGVGYDAAGDLTSDGSGPGSHTYFYDAENRIIQVDGTLGNCSTATACYVYNADGQRARKTTGGSSMDYLYDLAGHKVADVAPAGVFMRGELYAGNRHFAIYAPAPGPTGATFFTHSDWLGTERVRTDMTGTNCESISSLPFGDGQSITGTCGDVSPLHFTGKERDSESGLDNFGARYDSSSIGRFMSPDPLMASATVYDPQTWNRYAYALNNPLRYIDPTGMKEENAADCQKDKQCVTVKVNVIYDQKANLTDKQKETFNKQLLQEAKDEYGDAHIHLDVSYTAGGYDDKGNIQGASKDSINVIVSDFTPSGTTAVSQVTQSGYALTQVNINTAAKGDLAHEFAHDFLGDTTGLISSIARKDPSGIINAVSNAAFDIVNDGMREAMKNPSPFVRSSMVAPQIFNSGAKQFQQTLTQQAAIRPRQ